jgi:protein arginine kinase activator
MKCQICQKNEANIIFTQIINNEKEVLHICSDCAKEKGISVTIEKPSHPKGNPFVGSLTGGLTESDEKSIPDLTCDVCGLTFADFKRIGLFGCDNCHKAFGEHTPSLLKQIHGTVVYCGKNPGELSEEGEKLQQLQNLRARLQQCIETEDYERAAVIRDKIADLESKSIDQ